MPLFRNILQKLHHYFQKHYPYIWFVSVFAVSFIGFLHFELKQNNKDLLYWTNLIEYCFNEMGQIALILILFVVLIKVIFVGVIIMMNSRSLQWYDELTQLEVKKRYADFLLLRLINDIDKVEAKYLRNGKPSDIIALKSFILAHENLKKTIESFRKDARKLLSPTEVEITLPIEEVYGLLEDEERLIRCSRYLKKDINANDDLIKKLVNP